MSMEGREEKILLSMTTSVPRWWSQLIKYHPPMKTDTTFFPGPQGGQDLPGAQSAHDTWVQGGWLLVYSKKGRPSFPESEKPRQRVSNADRKVFANPESFGNKLIICWRISGYFGKCPDTIQNIQMICKVGMNWKCSIWCKKCPDNLKNVSGYSKKSLDNVKMYLENLEGSGWS